MLSRQEWESDELWFQHLQTSGIAEVLSGIRTSWKGEEAQAAVYVPSGLEPMGVKEILDVCLCQLGDGRAGLGEVQTAHGGAVYEQDLPASEADAGVGEQATALRGSIHTQVALKNTCCHGPC